MASGMGNGCGYINGLFRHTERKENMKKIIFALLAVIVLAGCQSINVTVNPGVGPCEITVSDSNNKTVEVPTRFSDNTVPVGGL